MTAVPGHEEGRLLRMRGPVAVVLAAGAVLAVVAVVDPHESGHYPTCPFLLVTGLWCPGCGTLRTLNSLVHGDLVAATTTNLLTTAAVPLLAWWWVRWTARRWRGAPRPALAPPWRIWALLVLVLVFGVLRNLPAFAVLAP